MKNEYGNSRVLVAEPGVSSCIIRWSTIPKSDGGAITVCSFLSVRNATEDVSEYTVLAQSFGGPKFTGSAIQVLSHGSFGRRP